jgi:hypothetical protein
MAIKDWTQEAATEIAELPFTMIDEVVLPSAETIYAVILKHCPMLPDVAYMLVPRCDSCRAATRASTGSCSPIRNTSGALAC